jgi:hypothetical protein
MTTTRYSRFRNWTQRAFGRPTLRRPEARTMKPDVVRLEDRTAPATFVVTNILDNQSDATGGLSLRQAILAANDNPGFDKIIFQIPISPSLPTIPGDPNENYFPIVLATTLPDLTDPAGVFIDATTQPRFNKYDPTLPAEDPINIKASRPIVQLLPDPNPGAFPNEIGAFLITGQNNVVRGFVVTGFPGSGFNIAGPTAQNNIILGTWINTDISGTKSWNQDPIILSARPPGTPPELTNAGPFPLSNTKFVLNGIALTSGANSNIIGGTTDVSGVPLVAPDGTLIGVGGVITRTSDPNAIPITASVNRNIISGTPEFRKDYILANGKARERDIAGASSGPGIRLQDPGTKNNLIQGNFIGTDFTGTLPIPNDNGIEIYNAATSNHIGNPVTPGLGNLIRYNTHDGVRLGQYPNPSQIDPPPPAPGSPAPPWQEAYENKNQNVLYGPPATILGRAPFYDPYNPNYFLGKSPSGSDIIDGVATNPTTQASNQGIEGQVGTQVTIRGSNLNGAVSVTFTGTGNSQINAKFVVQGDTEIRATIPDGAITGPIRIFTPAGSVTGPVAVVLPSPQPTFDQIATFFPSQGIPSNVASDYVTIRGTNYLGTTQVLFGGVPSSKFTVNASGTEIQAFVPIGAKTGPITVVNVAGSVSSNRPFSILVQPPPRVLGVSATQGIPGETITITGELLSSAYLVRFNFTAGESGFATTDFTVVDDTTIVVKVPAAALPSNGTIQVVTSGGFGVSPQFKINAPIAPSITGFSSGSAGVVGDKVTITGTNFISAIGVTFNGVPAEFTIDSATQITAVIPFGASTGPVVVSTISNASAGSNFTVNPSLVPTISAVSSGLRNTYITIDGTNLQGTFKVLFGSPLDAFGIPSPDIKVISDTQIQVLVPVAGSNGSIHVFTPGGRADSTVNVPPTFAPTINSQALVNPVQARIGDFVVLEGHGLLGTQRVFFSDGVGGLVQAQNVEVLGDTRVRVQVPQGAETGPVRLEVPDRTPGSGPQFVLSADYEKTATGATNITSIFPLSGPVGTLVTVSGVNFTGAKSVSIGGFPVANYTVVSDRQITFRTPPGTQTGTIVVTGQSSTATSGQTYTLTASPFPVVQYSTPGSVRNGLVTISGTGLAGATQVVIGGFVAKFSVVSDFQLLATVPLNANTGIISVTTPGGTAISPTPFQITSAPLPAIASLGAGLPAVEDTDQGPAGSKFFINGANLNGVFRVEMGGVSVPFQFVTNNNKLMVTVPPTLGVGKYDVIVYAATKDVATAGNYDPTIPASTKAPNASGSGLNVDYSTRTTGNLIGTSFLYGAQFEVVPNAVPSVVTVSLNDSGGTGDIVRGAPISIFGSGFTGAQLVTINGVASNSTLFTVVSDVQINMRVPISAFPGPDEILGATISVTGPGGESTESVTFDIAADAAPVFTVTNSWGVATQGTQVTISAVSGNFYGTSNLTMTAIDTWAGFSYGTAKAQEFRPPTTDVAAWAPYTGPLPFVNFQIIPGTGGKLATAIVPTSFGKWADVPDGAPDGAEPSANIFVNAATNGGTKTSSNSVTLLNPVAPATSGVVTVAGTADPVFHRRIVIRGTTDPTQDAFVSLVSAQAIQFDVAFNALSGGGTGKVTVPRENFRVLTPGGTFNPQSWGIEIALPAGFGTAPAGYFFTSFFPTGNITIIGADPTQKGNATFTVGDQPVPQLFQYATVANPPQDNRIVGNVITQNGALTAQTANGKPVQATQFTNGEQGIDFVTPGGNVFFPFIFGYSRIDQGPPTGPPPGNHGRGGLNDGLINSFAQPVGPTLASSINTFNNVPLGRNFGPNLLQNFPLLQVVQSTVDRTTFSTALLGKPFRAYRIDYFFNPNFADQDATALATTTAGYGDIYLGSKIITTDAQGNGSVNFTIFVKQPATIGGPVPEQGLPSLSNFILPNNSPLPIGKGAGVVTSTATDLTQPGPYGPTVSNGPDGTSRFSFFKRPDNATGGILGRVIFDANKNGIADPNEVGVPNAKVRLYVDRGDGTLSAVPNSVQLTDTAGTFAFTTFTLDGGFGLPNGNHKLELLFPDGSTGWQYVNPADGIRIANIVNGNEVQNQDFFIYRDGGTSPPGPNPPGPNPPGPNPPGPNPPGPGPVPPPATFTSGIVAGSDAGRPAQVNVYNSDGSFRYSINPYGNFTGGVRVATGDVNGDGNIDIITVPGPGMAGVVNIYDGPTAKLISQFVPYEATFTGGLYVALGDVNGDGFADPILGTGNGGGPRVQAINGANAVAGNPTSLFNFFAYENTFRGGVLVASGDTNGDGIADIITGTGIGGGPRVQVFDGKTNATLQNFFAYEPTFRGGVFASAGDLDGDGVAEIVTGVGNGGGPVVKVFSPATFSPPNAPTPPATLAFNAYAASFRGGVRVDVTDTNADGKLDILTGPGPGTGAIVKAFDYADLLANPGALPLFSLDAFPGFFGGVFVGGSQ